MKWLVSVCLVFGLFAEGNVLKTILTSGTMRFDVEPIKAAEIDSTRLADYRQCIRWQLGGPGTMLFVQLERQDIPKYDIDANRFGPTSVQLGRQKLQLLILDTKGTTLLADNNVPSTGRTLSFSINNLSVVDVCLINISYDSSWKAIDMRSIIALSVYSTNQVAASGIPQISETHVEILSHAVENTNEFSDVRNGQYLADSEARKRNLNESTYSWLLCNTIVLGLSMFYCYCLAVPYYLIKSSREYDRRLKSMH
ncbi:HCL083Cp [Eremothecium sinecaudum]|uniref:HCL083Cp n=1 Tax=Eremothecium sinecaudum TaxID=45286 RepID=A0A109UYI2_9SACH|nr:HCL083Cp [Eremothecium sinecaudum]AMD20068.1 HCL083Cp [Eremothecium sinecaudum]